MARIDRNACTPALILLAAFCLALPAAVADASFADSASFVLSAAPHGTFAEASFSLSPAPPPGHLAECGPFLLDTIEGDVIRNGCVNVSDLVTVRILLGATGSEIDPPAADIDGNGIVNVSDLVAVRVNLRAGCE